MVGILFLSGFSYISSRELTKQIESLTKPNNKIVYLKEISTNITRFTNLYLQSPNSILFTREHDKILNEIQETLQLLRNEYSPNEVETLEALDSIPEILASIRKAHSEIRFLNKEYQDDFYSRVEEEILEKITINDLKDAGYVEEKVRQEIIKIIEKDKALKEKENQKINQETKQSLFSNIFKINKLEESPPSQNNTIEEKINKTKKEALLTSDIDNLFFSKKVEYIKNQVNKVLYQEQIKAIKIRSKEKQIFYSNIALINKLDSIFKKIQKDEEKKLRKATIDTYQLSKRFNTILILIILGLGISSFAILYFLFQDIERNKYYQNLLRKSEKKAIKKAKEKQQFLSTMSHELRTPLTSLIGYTELLDDSIPYKQPIRSSALYLKKVADDIFDLAKLEEGKIELKPERINIQEIFKDVEEKFYNLIIQSGLEPKFNWPKEDYTIFIDHFRIKQILYNIISNAIKFTKQGFVSVSSELKYQSQPTKIIFYIEDTGMGIDSNDLETIFQDFSQSGAEYDRIKGLGIGLGIVRKITEAMGGKIYVQSEKGKGSLFTVEIPFELSLHPIPKEENPRLLINQLSGLKILILEDDEVILKLYKDILAPMGAELMAYSSLQQAKLALESGILPNFILTDIRVPDGDSIAFLEEWKYKLHPTPIAVGVTANVFVHEEYNLRLKILDKIIFKPFTREGFIQCILDAIKESKKNPTLNSYNFTFLSDMAEGDIDILKENLFFLYEQSRNDIEILKKQLQEQNYSMAAFSLHKLNGRFSQLGIHDFESPYVLEKKLIQIPESALPEVEILVGKWESILEDIKNTKFNSSLE